MRIGVILPNTNLYGGVKRFFELGNRFVETGHSCDIFTPEGTPPSWFLFKGGIHSIQTLSEYEFDAVFITQKKTVETLMQTRSKIKIFYHVLEKENLSSVLSHPQITIFANSSNIYDYDRGHYKITPFKAFGGVSLPPEQENRISEGEIFRVLTYGRLGIKRKGTRFVIKACERLYKKYGNISLLLYDTPLKEHDIERIKQFSCKLPFEFIVNHPVEKNYELFRRADVFAIAEKQAGWSNTCAEAMACGVAVVATHSGTKDFLSHKETGMVVWRNSFSIFRAIEKLYLDKNLRLKLAKAGNERIRQFEWGLLAKKIVDYLENKI